MSAKIIKNILFAVGEPVNETIFKNLFPIYAQALERAVDN